MIEAGYLTWTSPRILRTAPVIDGRQLVDTGTDFSVRETPAPAGIATEAGTMVHQLAPAHRLASDAAQKTIGLSGVAAESGDWRSLLATLARRQRVTLFVEWPTVEIWRIRADDAVRTHWQLGRDLPRDLTTATNYPVLAVVEDHPDSPAPAGETPLVEITSGSPGPGEILVPEGVRVTELVTADLASEGPWRQLRVEFQPLFYVTIDAFDSTIDQPGALRFSMTLLESLLPRNYRSTA
jgi:hypothetical protein